MNSQLVIEMTSSSSWRRYYSLGFVVCVLLIVITTDLTFGYRALIAALCLQLYLLSYFYRRFYKQHQPIHITGCDIDEVTGYWQLLCPGRHQPILWQAQLLSCQSFYHCVQLIFDTNQPMQKRITVLIWKDQVSIATWRELKVLTRWS